MNAWNTMKRARDLLTMVETSRHRDKDLNTMTGAMRKA